MEKRVYFKNLSALRFIAATLVIFHHVEQFKYWAKLPNLWGNPIIDALGHKAVSFFFVLSGFLITYLLLEEKNKTQQISIKDFYIRRLLRIWPVYYLVVLLCLFVVPNVFDLSYLGHDMYDEKFAARAVLLLLVLPNVLRVYAPQIVGGVQLWTIGVEEQFYLIWPMMVRLFFKHLMGFFIAFIFIKLFITLGIEFLTLHNDSLLLGAFRHFWILLKIEQMAFGAIGAWILYYNRDRILKIIFNKTVWRISLILVIALFVIPFHHWLLNYFEAIVFVFVIMNLSSNPRIIFSMEHPVVNKLGNISYGIYMYHTLSTTVVIYTLTYFALESENWILFNVLLYSLSVMLTIIMAYFSYEYFEKKFLSLKERFMIVKSGAPTGESKQKANVKRVARVAGMKEE